MHTIHLINLPPYRSIHLYRCHSDPLISHGQHFGQTVHVLCNVQAIMTNSLLRLGELADKPKELFTAQWDIHAFCLVIAFPFQQTETREFGIQHSSTNDSRAWKMDSEWWAAQSHQNCWNGLIYSLFLPPSFLIITSYLQLQKGVSSARSNDTKSLKGAILDWTVPHGHSVHPPITHNVKIDRGFNHEHTGALLCPADMDWSDPE